jgi:hypothetical protein
MDLDRLVDQPVTLTGTARDARLGAVLVLDDRTPVYLAGVEEWPGAANGAQVSVAGTLRRRKLLPDPVVGPDGGISDGLQGLSFVVEGAAWSVVPA